MVLLRNVKLFQLYSILLSIVNFIYLLCLKGLSHQIDLKNVNENGQILALWAAAGF
jgi:hypothetical protein